ncbi:hypothetical protein Tco_1284947 [Tanacetum coccineum]
MEARLHLRDDKQFLTDHPGAVPITTAQGEELKKLIGAPAYIECSSKTQQKILLSYAICVYSDESCEWDLNGHMVEGFHRTPRNANHKSGSAAPEAKEEKEAKGSKSMFNPITSQDFSLIEQKPRRMLAFHCWILKC